MRDGLGRGALASAQERLGKRGPKPGTSRQARYRRRHPEYRERERARLAQLRARQQGDLLDSHRLVLEVP
jgi:hypothetical protein